MNETNKNFEVTPEIKKILSDFLQIRIWRLYIDNRDWIVIDGHKPIERGVNAADVKVSLPKHSFEALIKRNDGITEKQRQEEKFKDIMKTVPSSLCSNCIKSDVCSYTEYDTGKGNRRVISGTGQYANEIEIIRRVVLCLRYKSEE